MTNLYRHFNEAGALLYVGISLSAVNRLSAHSQKAPWFSEIARIEIEKFDTREAAQAAEKQAIAREKPRYNVRHVPKPEPVVEKKPEPRQPEPRQTDRLLTFREVHALVGSTCRTAHTALRLARRGLIEQVRLNERVIRYKESSVLKLVAGRADLSA